MKDISEQTFGRLTVLSLKEIKHYKSERNTQTKSYWLCQCSCGVSKVVRGEHLTSGRTTSCGCSYYDINIKHGHSRRGKKSQEYQAWLNMHNRLKSKEPHKIKAYADIGVSEDWDSFERFLEDLGDKPTAKHELDRIDPFLPYCKENCRWATRSEQMQNIRRQYV